MKTKIITSTCPYCKAVAERLILSGNNTQLERATTRFGPIFGKCEKCGKLYRKSNTYELAIMDPPAHFITKWRVESLFFVVFFGVMIVLIIISWKEIAHPIGAVLVCLGFCGWMVFADVIRYQENIKIVEYERWNSRERIKNDYEYAMLLMEAGYDIPSELINKKE